jgi:predicted RNA-binding Zn-ribbon protein involved in translation (DUF1610 family)
MDVQALQAMDADLARDLAPEGMAWGYEGEAWDESEQHGLMVYACRSCGGEIVSGETLGAAACPFCGNPVVMTSQFSGSLRPDAIIPFQVSKAEALQALQKHYMGKRLLPKVFQDSNHLEEVKGVYVPFWLFDAEVDAEMEYSATQIRHWSDSNYNYTETSTFRIVRQGAIGFSQVPVDGSNAMDDALMESIEPFHLESAEDFRTAYLAGYAANKYDVDAQQSIERANERIRRSTESAFASTVAGYATVTPQRAHVRLKNGGVRYALLPVWLLSTRWQGKPFSFAMNGQTGKFVGDLPLDKAAFRKWFAGIFGVAAAALLAVSMIIVHIM